MYDFPHILQYFDLNKDSKVFTISDIDLSYIAGIVDGEGSFIATKNKDHFNIRLSIETSDDIIVPYISSLTGISYKIYNSSNGNDKYVIHFWSSNLIIILAKVIPFLKLKRVQAIVSLNLLLLITYNKLGRAGYVFNPFTQEKLFNEIKDLNKQYKIRGI